MLDTIKRMHQLGIWIEVTTLLIPDFNDSEVELHEIAQFINDVDPGIPWHISRFYPAYKMTDRRATTIESVQKAREIGLKTGLRYVISGNIPGDSGESTYCYSCGEIVIERVRYQIIRNNMKDGHCPKCRAEIDGVF